MDGRRFDDLARSLSAPGTRRRLLGGWLAAAAAAVTAAVVRGGSSGQAQVCAGEGAGCTMMVPCCAGLFCFTLALNPNAGVCRPGGTSAAPPPQQLSGGSTTGGDAAPATRTPRPARTPEPTATATPTPAPTATPDPKDGRIAVTADCLGDLESTQIENTGRVDVTIEKIRTLAPEVPGGEREFTIGRRLRPGEIVRFASGPDAENGRDRLTTAKLYRDDARGEIVAVETSAGTFRGTCGRTSNGDDRDSDPEKERVSVTLVCDGRPEITRVTNRGEEPITVREIRTLRGGRILRRFPRSVIVAPTRNGRRPAEFRSNTGAPDTGRYFLDESELYRKLNPPGQNLADRVEVETLTGTYTASC